MEIVTILLQLSYDGYRYDTVLAASIHGDQYDAVTTCSARNTVQWRLIRHHTTVLPGRRRRKHDWRLLVELITRYDVYRMMEIVYGAVLVDLMSCGVCNQAFAFTTTMTRIEVSVVITN